MKDLLKSKKAVVSILGILVVFVLALLGRDMELVKWVGGFVTGIVSSFTLAQGFADGVSRGAASSSTPTTGKDNG
jgi:hypothetical protein